MSWGERSCGVEKEMGIGCGHDCTMATCNVDCLYYVWDGKTNPDSKGKLTKTQKRLMREKPND